MSLFLLSFLLFSSYANSPPCMTRMIAVNVEKFFDSSEIIYNKKCYEDVPDYMTEVYGHNMKTECTIFEDVIGINKGNEPLSRCGQCLELVGPTLKTIDCVVTQTLTYNGSDKDSVEYYLNRTIGVSEEILTLLTTNATGTNGLHNQITARQTDCKFHIKPTLHVVDTNETTTSLQIINSNKIIEKIISSDGEHYLASDAHFYVSTNSNLSKIIAFTLDGNSTCFYDVNLTKISSYTSDTLMPIDTFDSCSFMLNPVVYSLVKEMEKDSFAWTYSTFDTDLNIINVPITNNQLLFTYMIDGSLSMTFKTNNIVLLNHHFDMFVVAIKSLNNFNLSESYIGLEPKDAVKLSVDNLIAVGLNYEMYSTKEGDYFVKSYRFFIPLNFAKYANTFTLSFNCEENSEMEVVEAIFHEKTTSSHESCDYESSQCYERECEYEDESYENLPWKQGCHPECGRCRTGYQCSKEGKCIVEVNYNTRSGDISLMILMISFAIFLFI